LAHNGSKESSFFTPVNTITSEAPTPFPTVYGPVKSWRYGRSLGIDPIGAISTCSFNCVYCQLGEIEYCTDQRQIFVPTATIIEDLQAFAPWDVDVITLSGSGEPTLAANLGEIITEIQKLTQKPVIVLTNGTLLGDREVCQALQYAQEVAVKLDATYSDQLTRINRPLSDLDWEEIYTGIEQFRSFYPGKLSLQTMVLSPWQKAQQQVYCHLVRKIQPDTIQLNSPTRPKPLTRQLDGRGNHTPGESRVYPVHYLKSVSSDVLQGLAAMIQQETGVPTCTAPQPF
jgi:wyosine [tRNA(Phe)-imidazoG37] synthetase (radical SAM superfamily)